MWISITRVGCVFARVQSHVRIFLISRYLQVHLIVIFIQIISVVIKSVKSENMNKFLNFFCVIIILHIIFSDAAVPYRISDIDMHPHISGEKSLTAKAVTTSSINNAELTKEYWLENAKKLVTEKVNAIPNTNKAKRSFSLWAMEWV